MSIDQQTTPVQSASEEAELAIERVEREIFKNAAVIKLLEGYFEDHQFEVNERALGGLVSVSYTLEQVYESFRDISRTLETVHEYVRKTGETSEPAPVEEPAPKKKPRK